MHVDDAGGGVERKRSDDRFAEGTRAFQEGRFDEAEQKFKNVRAGTHLDEAKQYLAKIPAARQEKASGEAENAKFDHALQAYQRNDFAAAKAAFGQITGKRAGEAQTLLGNIKRFEDAMASGDSAAGANDPAKALTSYNQAAAIKPDGPGDPRAKVERMQSLVSAAAKQQPALTPVQQQPPPQPAAKAAVTAVKETHIAVDVQKLLREAAAAQARGDFASASGKYVAVLSADPGNAVARQAIATLSAQNPTRKAGSEADIMLARAIREFYTGYTEDAEVHIKDYLNANGSKSALSHFYLGAIKLTRYYLAGERESDKKLLSDAKIAFRVARGTAGFNPPSQQVISPKILKVYDEASR